MDEHELTAIIEMHRKAVALKVRQRASCDVCSKLVPFTRNATIDGFDCKIYQCDECGDEIVKGRRRSMRYGFMEKTG